MEKWELKGHTVEYEDETHTYKVDGKVLPSITQIMKLDFGHKYDGVDEEVLKNASERGTFIHNVIEKYCKTGEETNIMELKGFKFLQKKHSFDVLQNEIPIILFSGEKPIACGRLDLVLLEDGRTGLGDIKATYELDVEYLTTQLNLYKLGYEQTYGEEIEFLRGIHLRKKVAEYVEITIDKDIAWDIIERYTEELIEKEGENQ